MLCMQKEQKEQRPPALGRSTSSRVVQKTLDNLGNLTRFCDHTVDVGLFAAENLRFITDSNSQPLGVMRLIDLFRGRSRLRGYSNPMRF
jgi:hypothetical protein